MKSNPRRIPRSQADVNKAYDKGVEFGVEFAINCFLFTLKDKHDAPSEDMMILRNEFMNLMDSIDKGYLTYEDVKTALKGEYDLTVVMTKGKGKNETEN